MHNISVLTFHFWLLMKNLTKQYDVRGSVKAKTYEKVSMISRDASWSRKESFAGCSLNRESKSENVVLFSLSESESKMFRSRTRSRS